MVMPKWALRPDDASVPFSCGNPCPETGGEDRVAAAAGTTVGTCGGTAGYDG